jgi:N-acetylglutamate synthase-like GNAT family acetyltransferase
VWERLHASMRHWHRIVGDSSDGGGALERDGVVAALVPAAPERSFINAVVYEHHDALAGAYDEIAAAYAEFGAKWTVWVHAGDSATKDLLESKGHVLDGLPNAMGVDLIARPPQRPPDDELPSWTAAGDPADVGAINDRAYPFGGDSISRALTRSTHPDVHLYVAHDDGQAVACTATIDTGSNSEVQMVAVLPEARGRGLAGKLIAHSLADAVERGATTSTLVATQLGYPVYQKLGFEPLGVLEMWERRPDEG